LFRLKKRRDLYLFQKNSFKREFNDVIENNRAKKRHLKEQNLVIYRAKKRF